MTPADLIGTELDRLTLKQQIALGGHWIALEIYTRDNLAVRRIAAVGNSAAECVRQLIARGVDPQAYEFRLYKRPL